LVTSDPVPAVVGNGNQRRAFARHLVHTEQILECAVITGIGGDAFGDINGTATAHADQAVMPAFAVGLHAVFDDGDLRVGQHPVEDLVGPITQLRQCQLHRTGLDQRSIGDDQRVVDIQPGQLGGQLLDGAWAGEQFVGDLE
jgi:hypothetical protein